jgi:hypothetical protein
LGSSSDYSSLSALLWQGTQPIPSSALGCFAVMAGKIGAFMYFQFMGFSAFGGFVGM